MPKGGPDGGDGGDGGDVIVRAVAGTDSLADIVNRKHWRAEDGGRGMPDNCHGRKAGDLVIAVPPGTLIYDRDRGNVLRDLTGAGERGGGRPRRPRRPRQQGVRHLHQPRPAQTQPGTPGEERWIVLELKVIADAGLVGLPNAGKSTLLSRLSRAHPEIADYPFTTKHPNLGQVTIGGERAFILADLPGLIEGAHAASASATSSCATSSGRACWSTSSSRCRPTAAIPLQNYHTIRRELELHAEGALRPGGGGRVPAAGDQGQAGDRRGQQGRADRQRGSARAAGAKTWAGRCWPSRR